VSGFSPSGRDATFIICVVGLLLLGGALGLWAAWEILRWLHKVVL